MRGLPCLMLLLATLPLIACKSNPDERAATVRDDPGDGTIMTPYLEIGELLASDRVEGIPELKATLSQAAQTRSKAPGVGPIQAAVAELAGNVGDIEATRAGYRELSQSVLTYLDHHPDAREGLTLVYCPMTFANDGAYWVQRGAEVANPYEGARMPTCGAVLGWDEGVAHRQRWAEAHAQDPQ